MTENHRKQVIEVMSHPASQLADRLHLLRLAQLHFQLVPLGHILGHARNADRSTPSVTHPKGPVANPAHCAIGTNNAIFIVVCAMGVPSQRRLKTLAAVRWASGLP